MPKVSTEKGESKKKWECHDWTMQEETPRAGNDKATGAMAEFRGTACLHWGFQAPTLLFTPALQGSFLAPIYILLAGKVREVRYHGRVRLSAYLSETYTEGFRIDRIYWMCFKIIQQEGPGGDMDETRWATLITVEDGRRAHGLFSLLNVWNFP